MVCRKVASRNGGKEIKKHTEHHFADPLQEGHQRPHRPLRAAPQHGTRPVLHVTQPIPLDAVEEMT